MQAHVTWNDVGVICCQTWWCDSFTMKSVAGALFVVFVGLFIVVASVLEHQLSIRWKKMSCVSSSSLVSTSS